MQAGEEFILPDGKAIRVHFHSNLFENPIAIQSNIITSYILQLGPEKFRAPEILFTPSLVGLEHPGLPNLLVDSISLVDLDLRKSLYSNIVLSGGTTLTRGFGDRLLSDVRKGAVKDVKIKIYAPPERKYSTWIGGSILGSLSKFLSEMRLFMV
jgi:actin-related protein